MKNLSSFKSLVAGVLAISSLTMCQKKEESKPELSGTDASVRAVTTCTYTIESSQWSVDGAAIPAGSVVCLAAGSRGSLLLKNFKGTADKPITFINKGGKVIIKTSETAGYAFKTQNCQNFKIVGNGDASIKYGIEVDGGNIGVQLDYLSSDFEVTNVEVHNSGFAGIMAKTDPSCDQATWRGNFTLKNVSLHDNYVHNVGGEGFYVGNSFYANGRSLSCGTIMPHSIENAKIFNNITDMTACEGIQVGCAIKGLEVFNNTVSNFGQDPFANAQDNGIQIGEGSGGKCYNNLIKNGPGNGIIMLGLGDNVVFNNVIISPGGNGVFCDERYTPGTFFKFINNTIINPAKDGFKMYSDLVSMNTLMNNVVINPGSGNYITTLNGNVKIADVNNYFSKDIASCKFINVGAYDFRVNTGSPLIDKGANAASHGVTTDYYGVARPSGAAYDIGSTEFKSGSVTPTPTPDPTPTPTPDPTPTPTPSVAVTSLTLVNADTDKDIATLTEGYQVNLATIGTKNLNIRANTGTGAKSVVFKLNGNAFRTESGAPFAFAGDANGNYDVWAPAAGNYKVTAIPYSATNAGGTIGTEFNVNISIVNSGTVTPTPTPSPLSIASFTLINADTDKDIMTIKNGDIVSYSTIGTSKINIRANAASSSVKSIIFTVNGQNFRTESGAPFSLNGDGGGNYSPWSPAVGSYKIAGTPYASSGGTGTKGTVSEVTFSIVK